MLRFANQLAAGLRAKAISVEIFSPPVVFGKFCVATSGFGKWIGYIDKYLIGPIALSRRVRSLRNQNLVVHICDHSNSFYTRVLQGTPHLVTCHDLLAVRSALGEIP